MVVIWLIFRREQILHHSDEVNCVPLSLVTIEGTPKREIQPWNKAETHSAVEIPVKGITTGHRVNLSMQVKR